MTSIELKYSLFREIDSIEDESMLFKLSALIKSMLLLSKEKPVADEDKSSIPVFIRNMSVKTDIPANIDAKELMHLHWEENYGESLS